MLAGGTVASGANTTTGSIQDLERELEKHQAREYRRLNLAEPKWPVANPEEERKQAEQYVQRTARAWNLNMQQEAQLREKVMARLAAVEKLRPPTRYENPATYRLIRRWAGIIEDTARSNFDPGEVAQIRRIVFGTSPAAEVNAMHFPATTGGSLVLFNSGWFAFADLMSRALVLGMPTYLAQDKRLAGGTWHALSTQEAEVRKHLAQNQQILLRFYQPIYGYLTSGRGDAAPPFFFDALDEPREGAAAMYFDAMGIFVIAHEFGHAVQHSIKIPTISQRGIEDENRRRFTWEQEVQADNVGVVLGYLALERRPRNLPAILSGISFFLKCTELMERGASIIATGQENALVLSSHPPAAMRRQLMHLKLREFLRQHKGASYSDKEWEEAVADATGLERVMEIMWERTRPWFVDANRRGEKLSNNFIRK
jgi:hypothetical protein